MKIETTLGTIIVFGGIAFVLGTQYEHHRIRERLLLKFMEDNI